MGWKEFNVKDNLSGIVLYYHFCLACIPRVILAIATIKGNFSVRWSKNSRNWRIITWIVQCIWGIYWLVKKSK